MTIRVTFFADLRRFLPRGADGPQPYRLGAGATVADLHAAVGIAPDAEITTAVDGELASRQTVLHDGAEVMLLSPMEGGADDAVERHYARSGLLDMILAALRATGKDMSALTPADLAPVDEFHMRGREATIELARRAAITAGERVLDVGCGLGGSVRYLAAEHGVRATGVDLTHEYVEVATELARLVHLDDRVDFRHGSALALPFETGVFDVVWTEHAQMNIADKHAFYGEIARVLRHGGRLVFHDAFQGPGGAPYFPMPWAEDASISALATPNDVRACLDEAGLRVVAWEDETEAARQWFAARSKGAGAPPALGLQLLMGSTTRAKVENLTRSLTERRIVAIQAVAEKT